jgi:hypothetical protein
MGISMRVVFIDAGWDASCTYLRTWRCVGLSFEVVSTNRLHLHTKCAAVVEPSGRGAGSLSTRSRYDDYTVRVRSDFCRYRYTVNMLARVLFHVGARRAGERSMLDVGRWMSFLFSLQPQWQ